MRERSLTRVFRVASSASREGVSAQAADRQAYLALALSLSQCQLIQEADSSSHPSLAVAEGMLWLDSTMPTKRLSCTGCVTVHPVY